MGVGLRVGLGGGGAGVAEVREQSNWTKITDLSRK